MRWKLWLKILAGPIVAASLCCLSPLLLFVFGLASVSVAASMADWLYYDWRWGFRIAGLGLLLIGLVWHWRSQGICTLDAVKRRRNEVLNQLIIGLTVGVLGYLLFLYVVVHYIGVWLNIWQ